MATLKNEQGTRTLSLISLLNKKFLNFGEECAESRWNYIGQLVRRGKGNYIKIDA